MRYVIAACLTVVVWSCQASSASAQILIWSLPETDGSWVRFEGVYKNTQISADANAGKLDLDWRAELTIKSVGTEKAKLNDAAEAEPCRWVEFKSVTGKASEQGIQPGPFGTRIYKVLIPEKYVTGRTTDADGIPVLFLPIVRGYRKIGERDPEPVSEKALSVYPLISLVTFYPDLKPVGEPETLDLPIGMITARLNKGTRKVETSTLRSLNEGSLWLADGKDVPFGLAKFQVKVARQEKDGAAPRSSFKETAEIQVEMSAVAKGTDAASELPDQK